MRIIFTFCHVALVIFFLSNPALSADKPEVVTEPASPQSLIHLNFQFFLQEGGYSLDQGFDHTGLNEDAKKLVSLFTKSPHNEYLLLQQELRRLSKTTNLDWKVEFHKTLEEKANGWLDFAR